MIAFSVFFLCLTTTSIEELGLPASESDPMAGDQLTRSAGNGLFALHSTVNHRYDVPIDTDQASLTFHVVVSPIRK